MKISFLRKMRCLINSCYGFFFFMLKNKENVLLVTLTPRGFKTFKSPVTNSGVKISNFVRSKDQCMIFEVEIISQLPYQGLILHILDTLLYENCFQRLTHRHRERKLESILLINIEYIVNVFKFHCGTVVE